MGLARNLARLIVDASGNIDASNLDNAVPADGSITEAKLANSAVTNAKISTMAATKLTGQVPDANAPSGSVIQVVQAMSNGDKSYSASTSSSWQAVSGTSATITPTSASSKILVFASVKTNAFDGDNPYWGGRVAFSVNGGGYSIVTPSGASKDGSAQAHFDLSPIRENGGGRYRMSNGGSVALLHSPNTTESITYRLEVAGFIATLYLGSPQAGGADDNYWTEPYGVTLMEISA
jgi:hypothetical protein